MFLPTTLLLTTLLASLATTTPIQRSSLTERAGAPIARPIPSDCTIMSALAPIPLSNLTSFDSISSFRPTDATTSSAQLYSYYLPSYQTEFTDQSTLLNQCLTTCYGYGDPGQCKAVYLAYDVPRPPMFGAPGGELEMTCLMFSRVLGEADFEVVEEEGGYVNATAADIVCPS